MQSRGEIAAPKMPYEVRGRPLRGRAWLRSNMVSSNKVDSTYGKTRPCHVITYLHVRLVHMSTEQQMNPEIASGSKDCRCWLFKRISTKVEASHLSYLASIWDTAKSGMGCSDDHHLNYFAESINVNVGDSQQNAKVSSPPLSGVRVGATIVVRARENRVHGEGSQFVENSQAKVSG